MIDTHAHLADPRMKTDLQAVLERAISAGVKKIIAVGTTIKDSRVSLEISRTSRYVYASAGVHPHEASGWNDNDLKTIENMAKQAIAIGEIGLDYHYNNATPEQQVNVFLRQMELAVQLEKPVIIHCREAFPTLIPILSSFSSYAIKGVIHCFSGCREDADRLLAMGYYLSFGGLLTFKNAKDIQDIFMHIPLSRVLLETDCPYLSPVPFRGKRNEPAFIRYIYQKAASLRSISLPGLTRHIAQNVACLFSIV